jgi:hypothetical protein
MSRRGSWGSMTDRVQRAEDTPPAVPVAPSSLKHCWVSDRYGRLPALLLEWRRTESGFQGRVVRPVYEDEGWIVVEEWLPAVFLEPA